MLSEERESEKDRRSSRGQIDTKRWIAAAHERPVQGRTDIGRRLAQRRLAFFIRCGGKAYFKESLRVTPSLGIRVAAFFQLLLTVRPSSVEQAIAEHPLLGSCDHQ